MMSEMKRGVYTNSATGEVAEFNYYTDISTATKIKLINNVLAFVVGTYYYPMLRNIIFDYALIQFLTDIQFDEELKIDQIEELMNTTNIVDIVKMDMKDGLLDELNRAVDMNIEYKTGIRVNRIEDAVTSFLKVVEEKAKNTNTDEVMSLARKLNSVADDLTPEKMIEAYAKSELSKQRMQEAKEEKKSKKNASGGLRVIE